MSINGSSRMFGNSGTLDVSGGTGTSSGGSGGYLEATAYGTASMRNSGDLFARGGACTDTNCTGGAGGQTNLLAQGTPLYTSGNLDASGGNGQGTSSGGYGGTVTVRGDSGTGAAGDADMPARSMQVSGNLRANGGNGNTGGGGGYVRVKLDAYGHPEGQELTLLGYATIRSKGGNSTTGAGGLAFYVSVYNTESYPLPDSSWAAPGGAVLNYVNLVAQGGNGATGGPVIGSVRLSTQTSYNFGDSFERVINHGTLTVQGGTGATSSGGYAGSIGLSSLVGVENDGTLAALGGNATAPGTSGNAGGYVTLACDYGPVLNKGTVDVTGGGNTAAGGVGASGGGILLTGVGVTNNAALTAAGGNGGATTTGFGGSGGNITLFSMSPGPASVNTSTYAVGGGTGVTLNGAKGSVTVDGIDATP